MHPQNYCNETLIPLMHADKKIKVLELKNQSYNEIKIIIKFFINIYVTDERHLCTEDTGRFSSL
jgi:hypothetical protein